MKQFVQLMFFLWITTGTYAQSNLEAKMAYQLAEEKFDAKQYGEALDYLQKAEIALGSTNPPMLFLKVMITNQIVSANESMDNYQAFEKAIADFDKHKNKEALGEEKLMEVYRIKMNVAKHKTAYAIKLDRIVRYIEMVSRLAVEFPKTETTLNDLLESIPSTWVRLNYNIEPEKRKKEKKFKGYYSFDKTGVQIQKKSITGISLKKDEDRVDYYYATKILNTDDIDLPQRELTVQEIGELLGISKQDWEDFTTIEPKLIYRIDYDFSNFSAYKISSNYDSLIYGYPVLFEMIIDNRTYPIKNKIGQQIAIKISKNTLNNNE